MANIKSAKKRILVIAKKTARNRSVRSAVKTQIKKVILAVDTKDLAAAQVALVVAVKTIDKAAAKGVYHKKTAARKKSTLANLVNSIA